MSAGEALSVQAGKSAFSLAVAARAHVCNARRDCRGRHSVDLYLYLSVRLAHVLRAGVREWRLLMAVLRQRRKIGRVFPQHFSAELCVHLVLPMLQVRSLRIRRAGDLIATRIGRAGISVHGADGFRSRAQASTASTTCCRARTLRSGTSLRLRSSSTLRSVR